MSTYRKIKAKLAEVKYTTANIVLPYQVSDYLLNQKRTELSKLESIYDASIGCQTLYLTMMRCLATLQSVSDWYCSDWGGGMGIYPAPAGGTACEADICAWTCCDTVQQDPNVAARCKC